MAAELVHGSGEIDGDCLIYRWWLHDTMFPGRGFITISYLALTGSVVFVELKIVETIKRSGLFVPWPNPGDPVCQDRTQRLWTNQKMAKTPSVAIDRALSSVSMVHER